MYMEVINKQLYICPQKTKQKCHIQIILYHKVAIYMIREIFIHQFGCTCIIFMAQWFGLSGL